MSTMKMRMITRFLTLTAVLLFCVAKVVAADPVPARQVLFTLGANERICQSEYYAELVMSGYKFAAVVENSKTGEYTFVFNGKRMATTDVNLVDQPFVFYIDPNRENGYAYCYELAGRVFVNLEGTVQTLGNVRPYGYGWVRTENGKYAFICWSDNQADVYVDGKKAGSYKSAYPIITMTENSKYAFGYRDDDKCYANINGKVFGPYYGVGCTFISDNGKFAFGYTDNDKKDYANINGKIFGPYYRVEYASISDNGKFAFDYTENDQKHYANINGNVIDFDRKSLTNYNGNDSSYDYYNYNDEREYRVKDGKETPLEGKPASGFKWVKSWGDNSEWDGDIATEAKSDDGKHIFFSDLNYPYVVIDGVKVGKSAAINARYDAKRRSFIWNSVEDKELVVYEYKLK